MRRGTNIINPHQTKKISGTVFKESQFFFLFEIFWSKNLEISFSTPWKKVPSLCSCFRINP
ncbi:MAG TPA: hypothetical protein DCP55_05355 [Chitinophagaceae bacterium]|nr:hypothetical protein [Chitinophagaceae bacterium]NDE77598.1 hypothetical protein [Chitinophagaceae bacterium]HAL95368.1 hypothetical protein [Chitinophagaceae bacterium]